MVTINHNNPRQDEAGFKLVDFRKSVRAFVEKVNKGTDDGQSSNATCPKGFKIVGWFKPSKMENESFVEVHEFHVISIEPLVNPLPAAMLALGFPKPAALSS